MPPKRQLPLKSNPPSASSSDEKSESEEQPPKPSIPKPPSSDEDAESGSGSESDNEPVKHMLVPRNAAPISSKPISDTPKSKRKRTRVKSNGPKRKVAKSVETAEDNIHAREEEDSAGGLEYPYLSQSMQVLNHHMLLPEPPQGLAGLVANTGCELKAFHKRWKAVLIAETKAYLERIDVVRDQTKLMLNVLESSDS